MSFFGLFAVRVQSGDYKIDQRSQSETWHEKDVYLFNRPLAGGYPEDYEIRTTDQLTSVRSNSQVVTTGKYGLGGITESRDYRDTTTDRGHYHRRSDYYLDAADDEWIEQHATWTLHTQNHNGTIAGHDYVHLWGSGDPDVQDPITFGQVASYDHVTDEDLFGGTPPSGPAPIGVYQVRAPGEGGQEGGAEEGQNGFQPGTIDVDLLYQRAGEALLIAQDYLDVQWDIQKLQWKIAELQITLDRGYVDKVGHGSFSRRLIDKDAYRKKIGDLERQIRFLEYDAQLFKDRLNSDYGDIEFTGYDGGHGADAIIRQVENFWRQNSAPHAIHSTGGPGDLLAFGFAGILRGVGTGVAATTAGNVAKNEVASFAKPVVSTVAAPRGLSAFARASEFGIKSYKDLQNLIKGTGLQAHHLIEQRFASILGQKARDMASIALTKAEHQAFTNAWRQAIGYKGALNPLNTLTANREQIIKAAREIYLDYPDILRALGL